MRHIYLNVSESRMQIGFPHLSPHLHSPGVALLTVPTTSINIIKSFMESFSTTSYGGGSGPIVWGAGENVQNYKQIVGMSYNIFEKNAKNGFRMLL